MPRYSAMQQFTGAPANAATGGGGGPRYQPQGYNPGSFDRIKGKYRDTRARRYLNRSLVPEEQMRGGRSGFYEGLADETAADPTFRPRMFQGFYEQAGQAIAAPALRDFSQQQAGIMGNIAQRFGGNASSEEARAQTNAADLFSRNLTEALARLAPQAAQTGLESERTLYGQQNAVTAQEDETRRQILAAMGLLGKKPKKKSALSTLGDVVGTVAQVGGAIAKGVSRCPLA